VGFRVKGSKFWVYGLGVGVEGAPVGLRLEVFEDVARALVRRSMPSGGSAESGIYLSIYLSICLPIYLSLPISISFYIYLYLYLSIYLSIYP